jgi:tRNA G18 (ribose-2'-O)-methylase SpoU
VAKNPRGFFGLVLYRPKNKYNVGSLIRTADLLGVSFFATVGARYVYQASDTLKSTKRIPLWHFDDWETFLSLRPNDARLVAVEMDRRATDLRRFHHPERAVYVLGAEDDGLPPKVLSGCDDVVNLTGGSYNLAVAGSIVLYHREGMQRARAEAVTP